MHGSVNINGYAVKYIATVKKVKNINFHVRASHVEITMPHGVDKEYIEKAISNKIAFIKRAQLCLGMDMTKGELYAKGSSLSLAGKKYIVAINSTAGQASIDGDYIVFSTDEPRAIMGEFLPILRHVAKEQVGVAIDKIYPKFMAKGVNYRRVIMKDLVSVWGMCRKLTGTITLNNAIGLTPPECVEYIVAHELSHLIVPNHSAAFYAVLGGIMPEWKKYKAMLKGYDLRAYFDK